jgi:hypothetical protein
VVEEGEEGVEDLVEEAREVWACHCVEFVDE